MASSITIPTISVSASIVIWFSVKPIAAIRPKVAISDVGIARAGDDRRAEAPKKDEDDDGRQNAAFDQVRLNRFDRRFDEDRLVADDFCVLKPGGKCRLISCKRSFTASATATVFCPTVSKRSG